MLFQRRNESTMRSQGLLVKSVKIAVADRPRRWTRRAAEASVNERSFTRQEALYDLVYVERLAPPQTSSGGLILLEPEDPPMHLARVVSVGDGAVGDSGAVTKNAGVAAGDLVYCKFPWGIGPKDEQFGEEGEVRRFSFLRYQDIAAVVKK